MASDPPWRRWPRWVLFIVTGAASFSLAASTGLPGATPLSVAADPVAAVVASYRARIPQVMAEQRIPGLAVAVVDANQTLWVEGFGHLDGPDSPPVTPDTIFSVQSMSKLFTATALMQAVAAGRLDLDAPITSYLPDFTVHSAFEQHPERKITLRMLLSHTAGFTHEAPIGNNNELDPGDFDAHVRSISQTWLRFPVGSGYAYSNLGIDLAGAILERIDNEPFADIMRDSLLDPLGMKNSTFDRATIRSAANRAVGHAHPYPAPPLYEPMTAAGGLYSSAADLARFLHFELNGGSSDGRVVLGRQWLDAMETVPPPHAGAPAGYALGVVRHRWNRWDGRPDLFDHGGGGYGFLSDLWWAPQLGIGVAVLTNSQDHHLQNVLALSILTDLVSEPGPYRDRLLALPWRAEAADADVAFDPPAGMADLVANAAMPPTTDAPARWATYSGLYRMPSWGVLTPAGPPDRFSVDAGVPYFDVQDDPGPLARHRLVEVQPGLFLADNGETLDFHGQVPTWRNFRLARVTGGPSPWQWAMLSTAALLALTWLLTGMVRAARHSAGSLSSSTHQRPAIRRWRRVTGATACAAALLTLANVGLLVWLPGLIDSGYLGWLALPPAAELAVHLPLALAVLGAWTVILAAVGWFSRWWSRAELLSYAALALAMMALVTLLASWHLVGWRMG